MRNSPTYTLSFSGVGAGAVEVKDFSDNKNAQKDLPFNYARVINNSAVEFDVYLDNDKTNCPSGTIIPISLDNRVFRIVKVENLGAAGADLKVECSNVAKASDVINDTILNAVEKFNGIFGR